VPLREESGSALARKRGRQRVMHLLGGSPFRPQSRRFFAVAQLTWKFCVLFGLVATNAAKNQGGRLPWFIPDCAWQSSVPVGSRKGPAAGTDRFRDTRTRGNCVGAAFAGAIWAWMGGDGPLNRLMLNLSGERQTKPG